MGNVEGHPGTIMPSTMAEANMKFESRLHAAQKKHDPNYVPPNQRTHDEWMKRHSDTKNCDYWINSRTGETVYKDPTDGANTRIPQLSPELKAEVLDTAANQIAVDIALDKAETEEATRLLFDLVPVLDKKESIDMMLKTLRTKPISPNLQDKEGNTLLLYAAEYNHFDMAYHLINTCNCDVNIVNMHGCSALHFACSSYSVRIAELLLQCGINHELIEYDHGATALHYAAGKDSPDLIATCLKYECNQNCPDHQGYYPVDYAKQAGLTKNVELLEAGGNKNPPADAQLSNSSENSNVVDLVFDWEEFQDENGDIYFYNTKTQKSQWERPNVSKEKIHNNLHQDQSDTPDNPVDDHNGSASNVRMRMEHPGGTNGGCKNIPSDGFGVQDWETYSDNGKIYYYNKKTRESQWEMPVALAAISGKAQEEHLENVGTNLVDNGDTLAALKAKFAKERKVLQDQIASLESANELLKHENEQIAVLQKHIEEANQNTQKMQEIASKTAAESSSAEENTQALEAMSAVHEQSLESLKQQSAQALSQLQMKLESKAKADLMAEVEKTKQVQHEMDLALAKAKLNEDAHVAACKKDMQRHIDLLQHNLDLKEKEIAQAKQAQEEVAADKQKAVNAAIEQCHAKALGDLMGTKMMAKIGHKHDEAEKKKLMNNFLKESSLRRKIYNELEDLKGAIRVYCRMRPESHAEKERGAKMCITLATDVPCPQDLKLKFNDADKPFTFDRVFGPQDSQKVVFEDTRLLIQSAVDGFNVCLFCYGQTGAGKSYTMIGAEGEGVPPELKGITPRAVDEIWAIQARSHGKYEVSVELSMLELYEDNLFDLLRPDDAKAEILKIKIDKKNNVEIMGGIREPVETGEKLMERWAHAMGRRHIRATKMNSVSSRSHLVQMIYLTTVRKNGKRTVGKLTLVDLAGSERTERTGTTGEGAKEALAINKSLSALGNVINAITTNQKHIPYRDSNLTMLMRDSIGGNSKTLMFVNISPADDNSSETFGSLNFALRCKKVCNEAKPGVSSKELEALKREIQELKAQIR